MCDESSITFFLLLQYSNYHECSQVVVTMTSSATNTYKFTPGLDLRGNPTLDVFS